MSKRRETCVATVTIRLEGGLESATFGCCLDGVHYEHKWWIEKEFRIVVDVSWPFDANEDASSVEIAS